MRDRVRRNRTAKTMEGQIRDLREIAESIVQGKSTAPLPFAPVDGVEQRGEPMMQTRMTTRICYTDGSAQNNPGAAGCAAGSVCQQKPVLGGVWQQHGRAGGHSHCG